MVHLQKRVRLTTAYCPKTNTFSCHRFPPLIIDRHSRAYCAPLFRIFSLFLSLPRRTLPSKPGRPNKYDTKYSAAGTTTTKNAPPTRSKIHTFCYDIQALLLPGRPQLYASTFASGYCTRVRFVIFPNLHTHTQHAACPHPPSVRAKLNENACCLFCFSFVETSPTHARPQSRW